MRSTHSARLERYLGVEETERISRAMRGWYGPPIALARVPGTVYATGDGDFVGAIKGGQVANAVDFAVHRLCSAWRRAAFRQQYQLNAGFTGLSDLISEMTSGGKGQLLTFTKTGTAAGSAGQPMSLFNVGPTPPAGGVGGTSGTGRVCTNTTTGALRQANPASGSDTQHLTTISCAASVINTLLLYDRLWDMTYNHASSTSTAVDTANLPTRYTSSTATAMDYAGGTFISGEVTTALSATAHNITITYRDQANNTAEAAAAYAAPVSAAANRLSLVSPAWYMPLNSGDVGVRSITNVAQSTITSVTGVTSWFLGHPIAIMPMPVANMSFILDGINSAFNLQRIFDDACLAFLEFPKTATTATTYNGFIQTVSG